MESSDKILYKLSSFFSKVVNTLLIGEEVCLEIAYSAFSNTHSQTEFNTLSKSMYLNQGRYMLAKK